MAVVPHEIGTADEWIGPLSASLGELGRQTGENPVVCRLMGTMARRGEAELQPWRTGIGSSTAAQARTWSRLTLRVCVRGKSASGHSRQAATRW